MYIFNAAEGKTKFYPPKRVNLSLEKLLKFINKKKIKIDYLDQKSYYECNYS